MSICWFCKKQIPDAVRICPHCAADQTTPGQRAKVARRLEDMRRAQPAAFMVMGEATGRRPDSKRRRGLWLGGALVAAIAITIWTLIPTRFDNSRLEAFEDDPCVQHERCVVVYLAPWSPASIRTLATMRRLAPSLAAQKTGFGVILGADDAESINALAEASPVGGWVDRDDRVPGALGIETVPTWFVLDANGKVLERVEGTYFPLGYHERKLGL